MHTFMKKPAKTLFIIMALTQSAAYSFYPLSLRDIITENKPLMCFLSATALMYAKSIVSKKAESSKKFHSESPQTLYTPSIWTIIIDKNNLPGKEELESSFIQDCNTLSENNNAIPNHSKNNETLRIATWNVFNWAHVGKGNDISLCSFYNGIFENIQEIAPDVLMLQEVKEKKVFKIDELKEKLKSIGYIYNMELDPNSDDGTFNRGNMIFSKYPILESEKHLFHTAEELTENRGWQKATLELHGLGNTIDIINTHLDVFNILNGKPTTTLGELRVKEADMLLRSIKDKKNVIIAGDFNCIHKAEFKTEKQKEYLEHLRRNNCNIPGNHNKPLPEIDALDVFDKNGFASAFNHVQCEEPKFTTWTATSVDKILVHKDFEHKIIGAYVYHPKDPRSDHLPIITDIKINNRPLIKRFFTLVKFYKFSNIFKGWRNY